MSAKTNNPLKFWRFKSHELTARLEDRVSHSLANPGSSEYQKEIIDLVCAGAVPPGPDGGWAETIIKEVRSKKLVFAGWWAEHGICCYECYSNPKPAIRAVAQRLASYRDEATGSTLLHYCASMPSNNYYRIGFNVGYLIDIIHRWGGDGALKIDAIDRKGRTPLHVAAEAASDDTMDEKHNHVKTLMDLTGDDKQYRIIDAEDNLGRTALHIALAKGARKAAVQLMFPPKGPWCEAKANFQKPKNRKLWDLLALPGRLEPGVRVEDVLGKYHEVCDLIEDIYDKETEKRKEEDRKDELYQMRVRKARRLASEKQAKAEAEMMASQHCDDCRCDKH